MTGAEGLSPDFMLGSLWRVAGEGMGLLYARSAMSVKPARRRVRSATVVSERSYYRRVDGALRTSFHYMRTCVPVC